MWDTLALFLYCLCFIPHFLENYRLVYSFINCYVFFGNSYFIMLFVRFPLVLKLIISPIYFDMTILHLRLLPTILQVCCEQLRGFLVPCFCNIHLRWNTFVFNVIRNLLFANSVYIQVVNFPDNLHSLIIYKLMFFIVEVFYVTVLWRSTQYFSRFSLAMQNSLYFLGTVAGIL